MLPTMSYLSVALFCMLQFSLLQQGNCYRKTTYPIKNDYKPGETFRFGCAGSLEEGETFHFTKLSSCVARLSGSVCTGDDEEGIKLSTFGDLDPLLLAETDRYTIEGTHDDISYDYSLTITDVQPEDIGNFSCIVRPDILNKPFVALRVLGPIKRMAILHQLKKDPEYELENSDGIITYDSREAGDLICMVDITTTPPIFWEMTLYDPYTKTTENVTSKFKHKYTNSESLNRNGGLRTFIAREHFFADAPREGGKEPRFDYKDSGKTLKFRARVEGYEVQEVETVIDIQFPPKETMCSPGFAIGARAPVGTKNYTLLCCTRSVPEANVSWRANSTALRSGISIQNSNEGPYLVSQLIIEEVQESDFVTYSFHAENEFGSAHGESIELTESDEVSQADMNAEELPWNKPVEDEDKTNKVDTVSCSVTLMMMLLVICAQFK